MGDDSPRIIACIPAYGEENTIAKIILKTKKYVDEVIVCDDGSQDMTAEIAEALGATVIRHERNMGYGAALRTLFLEARKRTPDVMVTLDADDQHDPDEITRLAKVILEHEADVVIGSRYLGRSNIPRWRSFGVKLITWLTRKTTKLPGLTDAQSGFRAYSKKAIQLITPEDSDMGASIDILHQAKKHQLKIVEVPITINYHNKSSTQNPVKHAAKVITRIIQLVVEEKPLKYLGTPGLTLILMGTFSGTQLILLFNKTRYFSIPLAIITLGTLLTGLLLIITAIILHMLNTILERTETRKLMSQKVSMSLK